MILVEEEGDKNLIGFSSRFGDSEILFLLCFNLSVVIGTFNSAKVTLDEVITSHLVSIREVASGEAI